MRDHPMLFAGAWLLTYLMHSSVLLGGTACVSRLPGRRVERLSEAFWRVALFGGVITTSVQLALSSWHPALPIFRSADSLSGALPAPGWPVELLSRIVHDALPRIASPLVALWALGA